jgi:hypothetical protein
MGVLKGGLKCSQGIGQGSEKYATRGIAVASPSEIAARKLIDIKIPFGAKTHFYAVFVFDKNG